MKNNILILTILLLSLTACQTIRTRDDIKSESKQPSRTGYQPPVSVPQEAVITDAIEEHIQEEERPAPESKYQPKLGLILGPGAMRAFIHIGILQELDRARIPVTAIAGLETSSLVAAAYAAKGQGFDLEWQLFKIKEAELIKQSLLGKSDLPGDFAQMNKPLEEIFKGAEIGTFKVPFSCSSLNLDKRQVNIYSRGKIQEILPYCMSHYPLFKAYRNSVATTLGLSQLAKNLRDKGATHVVYISVLGGTSPFDEPSDAVTSQVWQLVRQTEPTAPISQINDVITVDSTRPLTSYSARREHLTRGQKAGKMLVERLIKTGGF